MSSDMFINTQDLLSKGEVSFSPCVEDGSYTIVKIGDYEYWREVQIQENVIHISCGGVFRQWIQEYCKSLGIRYEII